jgi:hypothetical protein
MSSTVTSVLRRDNLMFFARNKANLEMPSISPDPAMKFDVDHQTGGHITTKSSDERRYVARLDAFLLVFLCISTSLVSVPVRLAAR